MGFPLFSPFVDLYMAGSVGLITHYSQAVWERARDLHAAMQTFIWTSCCNGTLLHLSRWFALFQVVVYLAIDGGTPSCHLYQYVSVDVMVVQQCMLIWRLWRACICCQDTYSCVVDSRVIQFFQNVHKVLVNSSDLCCPLEYLPAPSSAYEENEVIW